MIFQTFISFTSFSHRLFFFLRTPRTHTTNVGDDVSVCAPCFPHRVFFEVKGISLGMGHHYGTPVHYILFGGGVPTTLKIMVPTGFIRNYWHVYVIDAILLPFAWAKLVIILGQGVLWAQRNNLKEKEMQQFKENKTVVYQVSQNSIFVRSISKKLDTNIWNTLAVRERNGFWFFFRKILPFWELGSVFRGYTYIYIYIP